MFKYDGKGINIITGFDLTAQAPLDSRSVVETLAGLRSLPENRLYEGIKVFVVENKKEYQYIQTGVDEETGAKIYEWRQTISSDDTFNVINALDSDSEKDALSAKMGNELNKKIEATDEVVDGLSESLTTAEGDIDKLQEASADHETRLATAEANIKRIDGDENTEGSFRNLVKSTKNAHDQDVNTINGRLDTLETASENYSSRINTLEGDSTTEGSVAKAVADATKSVTEAFQSADSALDTKISNNKTEIEGKLAEEVTARQTLDTTIHQELAQTNEDIRRDFAQADIQLSDRITQNANDISTNAQDIQTITNSLNNTISTVNTHTTEITKLNADSNTEGSVNYKIKNAVEDLTKSITEVGSHRNIVENIEITDGVHNLVFGASIPEGYNVSDDSIKLIINGIVYVENIAFVANRNGAVIKWTLDKDNNGFDLDSEDVVVVDYFVKKASTTLFERVSITLTDSIITEQGDPSNLATYIEEIDLSAYSISNYYATIINGVTYSGQQAVFNEQTKILSIAGLPTEITDQVYIVMATPLVTDGTDSSGSEGEVEQPVTPPETDDPIGDEEV